MLDIDWNDWGTEKSLPALDRFLAAGGDVNAVDPTSGTTLLWLAAEQMDIPLIRRLGDLGANPNRKLMDTGSTPVHNAVDIDIDSVMQCEQPSDAEGLLRLVTFSVTQAMVAIGGSLYIADNRGKTPFDYACQYDVRLGRKLIDRIGG